MGAVEDVTGNLLVNDENNALAAARARIYKARTRWTDGSRLSDGSVGAAVVW